MKPATTVVSAGRPEALPGAPVNPGIDLSSTYRHGSDLAYGRDSNSIWEALEETMSVLEGGKAHCFSSGMAAISAVLETLNVGATVVVPSDSYSGTRHLLDDLSSRGRLNYRISDITDTAGTLSRCEGAELLWMESPTNPLLGIADLGELCRGAHELGLTCVVDNTFATPLLQNPLELGADIVVHSATKYLSGHSDVLGGVVIARDEEWNEAVRMRRSLHGAVLGPLEAFLVLRGIRTLDVRLKRAQSNAGVIAERLMDHAKVTKVRYPGLVNHPGHHLASVQMNGFGAMLSFEVSGGAGPKAARDAEAVCGAVRLCCDATSLGGVETLIERRKRWDWEDMTPEGLIRVSVGIEDVEDLWEDLVLGLSALE
ncbi:MAG TPA: aminotransferase class I/II-fold pyridoxal phosphate-dependent enzyme [Acidimicrobiales bacterium]|nr:aminotransferase class I/II-fold pyridoxal phosphate-dependent enzyme [Acidimicrobiales bacterium]